jgi:hypothetical protein
MKQLTIILAAAVIFFTASSFTGSPAPAENETVKTIFKKDFSNASEVTWRYKSGFYFASFSNEGERTEAAYDNEGNLVGTERRLYSTALPATVTDALTARFPKAMIGSHASEVIYDNETSYYVTVSTDKHVMYVTVASDLSLTVDRKIRLRNN